jgi:chromosome segregation ATPase
LVWAVAVTASFAGTLALADDSDPRLLEQRLVQLETNPETKQLTRDPVASARKALERVKSAHSVGDAPRAIELSQLARDYTVIAENVVRATRLEKELAGVQTALAEVEQKRHRTETLLEETVAHRERTAQALKQLELQTRKSAEPVQSKSASAPSTAPAAAPRKNPNPTNTTGSTLPQRKGSDR